METIRPHLIPCQKWAALKVCLTRWLDLTHLLLLKYQLRKEKIFYSSTEYAAAIWSCYD